MAYNAAPSSFFGAGYNLSTSVMGLTTVTAAGDKALVQLTDVEANATTGDWRKVVFAIMEQLNTNWQTLDAADRPTKLSITKNSRVDANTGIIVNTYTVVTTNVIGAQEVAPEA